MTDFSQFIINNMKNTMEPDELQIFNNKTQNNNKNAASGNGSSGSGNCHTIKEEDNSTVNPRLDYARRWAESVNKCQRNSNQTNTLFQNGFYHEEKFTLLGGSNSNHNEFDSVSKAHSKQIRNCKKIISKDTIKSNGTLTSESKTTKDVKPFSPDSYAYDASIGKIVKRKYLIKKQQNRMKKQEEAASSGGGGSDGKIGAKGIAYAHSWRSLASRYSNDGTECAIAAVGVESTSSRVQTINGHYKAEISQKTMSEAKFNAATKQKLNASNTVTKTEKTLVELLDPDATIADAVANNNINNEHEYHQINKIYGEGTNPTNSISESVSSHKVTTNPIYQPTQAKSNLQDRTLRSSKYDCKTIVSQKPDLEISRFKEGKDLTCHKSNEKFDNDTENADDKSDHTLENSKSSQHEGGFLKVFKAVFHKRNKHKKSKSIKKSKSKINDEHHNCTSSDEEGTTKPLKRESKILSKSEKKKLEKELKKKKIEEKKNKKKEQKLLKKAMKEKKKNETKKGKLTKNEPDGSFSKASAEEFVQLRNVTKDESSRNKKKSSQDSINTSGNSSNSSNGGGDHTLTRCRMKSREKMLSSWDQVVKKANKDPSCLEKMVKEQSDKALDEYKRKKSSKKRPENSVEMSSNANLSDDERNVPNLKPSNRQTDAYATDSEMENMPINQLLIGAGKQGELIRNLFSYLNNYGDDGFTIKPNGSKFHRTKHDMETNEHANEKKNGKGKGSNEKHHQGSINNNPTIKFQKSNVPYYLKCCLEVTPGPNSTIGSRRIIVEEGLLNRMDDSAQSKTEIAKNKEKAEKSIDDAAETIKKIYIKLLEETERNKANGNRKGDLESDFNQSIEKIIKELDSEGQIEMLKRKLSLYIKTKKSPTTSIAEHFKNQEGNLRISFDSREAGEIATKEEIQNDKKAEEIHKSDAENDNNADDQVNQSQSMNNSFQPISSGDADAVEQQIELSLENQIDRSKKDDNSNCVYDNHGKDKEAGGEQQKEKEKGKEKPQEKNKEKVKEKEIEREKEKSKEATTRAKENDNEKPKMKSKLNEPDLEMFYFTSDSPPRKTLFKTNKIFRGFYKHLQSSMPVDSENQKEEQDTDETGANNAQSVFLINVAAAADNQPHEPPHHYKHQNIFKTLLRSKPRQRMPNDACDNCKSSPCKCEKSNRVHDKKGSDESKTSAISRKKDENKKILNENGDKKGKNKRLEDLISELSSPEAIQALRSRYDLDGFEEEIVKRTPKPSVTKDKFQDHMRELANVLNEKFGSINRVRAGSKTKIKSDSNNGSRVGTRKRSMTKRTNTNRKAKNGGTISKINTKRPTTSSPIKAVSPQNNTTNRNKVRKRSTRIGWRPTIGKQPRSSKQLLQEISVIAKSTKAWNESTDDTLEQDEIDDLNEHN